MADTRAQRYAAYKAERQTLALRDALIRATNLPPKFFVDQYVRPTTPPYDYLGLKCEETGVPYSFSSSLYGDNEGVDDLYSLVARYRSQVLAYRAKRRAMPRLWIERLVARTLASAQSCFSVYRSSYAVNVKLSMFNHRIEERVETYKPTYGSERQNHILDVYVSPAYVHSVSLRLYDALNVRGVDGNFGHDFFVLNAHKLYVDESNATIYTAKVVTVKNQGTKYASAYEIEHRDGFIVVAQDNLAWGWGTSEKAAYSLMGRRLHKAFEAKLRKLVA